ncbi:hypothetical protein C0995_011015 [Termitomyces sp. Mi166|nr:hypothetical protein C0995_011015 [Termitomyces sp. Mi166\
MSIQFSFQGTAVYVYFILANFVNDGVTTETLCNFTLDDGDVVPYHHTPTSSRNYEFNALVFHKDNLPNKNHTLLISTSGVDRHLFTSFDYADYTFDDTPSTSSPSNSSTQQQPPTTTSTPPGNSHPVSVGTIVGGAVGGVLILAIIIIIFLCLRRRRRHRLFPSSHSGNAGGAFTTRGFEPPALTQGTLIEPHTSTTIVPSSRHLTLPPAYDDGTISNDETSSTSITSMRQAEIEDQIRGLTREMQALAGVKNVSKEQPPPIRSSFSFRRSRRERVYLAQIQQQMDMMRAEIEYLQAQLHSGWAHGLTDDLPPSYSVVVPGERGRDLSIRFP